VHLANPTLLCLTLYWNTGNINTPLNIGENYNEFNHTRPIKKDIGTNYTIAFALINSPGLAQQVL